MNEEKITWGGMTVYKKDLPLQYDWMKERKEEYEAQKKRNKEAMEKLKSGQIPDNDYLQRL